jgi:hypothetical protein
VALINDDLGAGDAVKRKADAQTADRAAGDRDLSGPSALDMTGRGPQVRLHQLGADRRGEDRPSIAEYRRRPETLSYGRAAVRPRHGRRRARVPPLGGWELDLGARAQWNHGDGRRLAQVLLNLVGRAMQRGLSPNNGETAHSYGEWRTEQAKTC